MKQMRLVCVLLLLLCAAALAKAQTAEELVARNIQAKGGLEKMKAVKSYRSQGKFEVDGFKADVAMESKRPDKLRQLFTFQRMTEIDAYDGKTGWKISPFQGKKDAEMMGEDDVRGLMEDADFDGPLVDAAAKGNKIEFQGKQPVDGDDAYVVRVTLKNGDIMTYYLDPDTCLEFRVDRTTFIRGAVRENTTEYGSYKPVNGVLHAYSIQFGPKAHPENRQKITLEKVEANVPLEDSLFAMPAVKSPQSTPTGPGAAQ
jgi:outer membrane lipoprotein-sorting protein